ncbi:MAG: nuclear transport factor 2 family protein, partial [Rhodobacteraceae bacterium]|nr:nuclear transport factor 2 family protein [Paracoccaceae bacterium]
MSYQAEKQVVRDYYAALDSTSGSDMLNAVGQYIASDYLWRGYHPFGEMTS